MAGPTRTQLREQTTAVARFNAAEVALEAARRTYARATGKAKIRARRRLRAARAEHEAAERLYVEKRLGGMGYPDGAGETVTEPDPPTDSESSSTPATITICSVW